MPVVNRGAVPGDQNADTAYAAFGEVNDKFDAVDIAVAAKADGAATTSALAAKADAAATTAALGFKADAAATTAALALKANVEVGMIVQTVAASSSTRDTTTVAIPVDNTIPQITEGKEYLTVTITPKFANSKIRLRSNVTVTTDTIGGSTSLALFVDAVANALSAKAAIIPAVGALHELNAIAEHSPGDTAAHTYRLRFGPPVNTQTAIITGFSGGAAFGGTMQAWLIAEEIKV